VLTNSARGRRACVPGAIGATPEALIAAFCRLAKSLSCCWEKGWLVGAVGIEPTYLTGRLLSQIEALFVAISSTGITGCTGIARARRAQDRSCGFGEFRGTQACLPNTVYGLPAACSHGRIRRHTEGFRDGLDCQPSIAG